MASATRLTLVSLCVAGVLAACGGSSKPSYCSSLANLKSSIKALPSTNIVRNGVSALETAISNVEKNAQATVDAAKSDFPTETSAVSSSVNTLSSTVKQLGASPSAAAIAQLPAQVSALTTAVKDLTSATSSKCS